MAWERLHLGIPQAAPFGFVGRAPVRRRQGLLGGRVPCGGAQQPDAFLDAAIVQHPRGRGQPDGGASGPPVDEQRGLAISREGLVASAERHFGSDRLEAVLSGDLDQFGGRAAPLPPLVVHVNPVGRQETDWRVWPVAALVLVTDPARRTRIDPAVAAAALGLTGMESRVAVLLAEGMIVPEVAAATGRKESTIRSHVKRMFVKHHLSRQADLVRLVQSLGGVPKSKR